MKRLVAALMLALLLSATMVGTVAAGPGEGVILSNGR